MNARRTARRTFLYGAGGIAVGLPFLETFLPRNARAQSTNTRLVIVYSPNGSNNLAEFMPSGPGADYTFGAETAPLTPYKNKLLVISGLDLKVAGAGDQHTGAIASMLTGVTSTSDPQFEDVATSVGGGWASGISFDQELAKTIGQTTKYTSLQFGVETSVRYGNHPIGRLSYAGPAQPIAPEDSPQAAYTRLFSNTVTPPAPGMIDANLKRDKSVMDFVIGEFTAVSSAVSADDKQRLDQHVSMLREVERGLSVTPVSNLASCTQTMFTADGDPSAADNFPNVAKQQRDLMVLALSCNLTRIASLQYSYARSLQTFAWLNLVDDHHTLSHASGSGAGVLGGRVGIDDTAGISKMNLWYASELAELLKRLDAVNEGGSTLLDNCLGWWCSDVAGGKDHNWANLRAFLFGSAGGRVNTGQHIMFGSETGKPAGDSDASYGWNNSEPHNRLHVTLLNAFGVPATTFGAPNTGSGPLAGILK